MQDGMYGRIYLGKEILLRQRLYYERVICEWLMILILKIEIHRVGSMSLHTTIKLYENPLLDLWMGYSSYYPNL